MRTLVQKVAMAFGVGFLVATIAGFVATGMSNMDPNPESAPRALGLFPVNVLHNIVHLLFGILGIAAARGAILSARAYFQVVAIAYTLLTLLGLIPATQTTFGLVPIWGNDVWLHAAIAAGAAYFGFVVPATAVARRA